MSPSPHTPWYPHGPTGGRDLFADEPNNHWIASFDTEEDCIYARHCVNTHAALAEALRAAEAADAAQAEMVRFGERIADPLPEGITMEEHLAKWDAVRAVSHDSWMRAKTLRAAALLALEPQPEEA